MIPIVWVAQVEPLLNVRFDGVGVGTALEQLFTAARRKWRLDGVTARDLAGTVTLPARHLRLSDAVALVLESARVPLVVRVVDGEYVIALAPPKPAVRVEKSAVPSTAPPSDPKPSLKPVLLPQLVVQTGHVQEIDELCFSPDGGHLMTHGGDGVRLWDITTGMQEPLVLGSDRFTYVTGHWQNPLWAFSSDGAQLYGLGYFDRKVVDSITGKAIPHGLPARGLMALAPNGRIAAVSQNQRIDLVRFPDGGTLRSIAGVEGFSMAFSPDGSLLLVSQPRRQSISAFRVQDGASVWTRSVGEFLSLRWCFLRDGTLLCGTLFRSSHYELIRLEVATGALRTRIVLKWPDLEATPVGMAPDGSLAALWRTQLPRGAVRKRLVFLDPDSGAVRHVIPTQAQVAALSPDGSLLAVASGRRAALMRPDATTTLRSLRSRTELPLLAQFTPDGDEIVAAYETTIARWSLRRPFGIQTRTPLQFENAQITTLSPDGRYALARANLNAGPGRNWFALADTATGRLLHRAASPGAVYEGGAFSPDSRRVLVWGKGAELREVASGKRLRAWTSPSVAASFAGMVTGGAFSADGRRIALLTVTRHTSGQFEMDEECRIVDAATGATTARFVYRTGGGLKFETPVFEGDRVWLKTRYADGGLQGRLWDPATGQWTRRDDPPPTPTDRLTRRNGLRVSAQPDGTIRLTRDTFQENAMLPTTQPPSPPALQMVIQTGHSQTIKRLAFSPDGTKLVSGGGDGTRVWDLATGLQESLLSGEAWNFTADSRWLWPESTREGRLFDTTTATFLPLPRVAGRYLSASPALDTFASGGDDGFALYTREGRQLRTADPAQLRSQIPAKFREGLPYRFVGDGGRIVQRQGAGVIALDARTGATAWSVVVPKPERWAVSPDGSQVAVKSGFGSLPNDIVVVDVATGVALSRFRVAPERWFDGQVLQLAFFPDKRHLAALTRSAVDIYRVSDGKRVRSLPSRGSGALAIAPDGLRLALTAGTTVRFVDPLSGNPIGGLATHASPTTAVRFGVGADLWVGQGAHLMRWNLATLSLQTFPVAASLRPDSAVWEIPEGYRTWDQRILDVAPSTGQVVGRVAAWKPDTAVAVARWKEKAVRLAGTAPMRDLLTRHTLALTETRSRRPSRTLATETVSQPAWMHGACFSPDGARLAVWSPVGAERGVRLVDARTGQDLWRSTSDDTYRACRRAFWSEDGRTVAVEWTRHSTYEVILHDAASGRRIGAIDFAMGDDRYTFLGPRALAPDGAALFGATFPGAQPRSREPRRSSWFRELQEWSVASGAVRKVADFQHLREFSALSVSPNGQQIALAEAASASIDREASPPIIRLLDRATGGTQHELTGHNDTITSLCYRSDSRQIASACHDATARLWNADDGEEIARFVALDSGDWIISTPEGYYTASKGAARAIGFRIEGQNYPFEQFDLKLNRPDIVLERLGYADLKTIAAYRELYRRRLKQAGATEDQLSPDFHTPLIRIDQKALPATTRLPVATIALRALDDRQKLNKIAVSVNGVPADGVDLAGRGLSEWAGSVSVDLAPGRNRIQVWAVNDQRAESRKQTFEVYFDDKAFRPDLFVLSIGVDKYQDPKVPTLGFAVKDATDVAAALAAPSPRWRKVNRLTLTNDKASRSGVEKAMSEFLSPARLGDTVIVYVAGHGFVADDYYFAAFDTHASDLRGTGVPFATIDGALAKLKARRRLLLLDTCHSGEPDREALASGKGAPASAATTGRRLVTRSLEPLVADPNSALGFSRSLEWMRELFSNLDRGSGATVIGASSWAERAIEDSGKGYRNGLFAYALLTGLKGKAADANKDGMVSVSELRSWMERVVLAESGGQQRPTVRQENLEDDFLIQ